LAIDPHFRVKEPLISLNIKLELVTESISYSIISSLPRLLPIFGEETLLSSRKIFLVSSTR